MASKAYVLVSMNEPVKNLKGTLTDNFTFKKDDVALDPQPANVFIPKSGLYAGKVLAELTNDQVPKKNEKITVVYTGSSSDIVKRDIKLKNLNTGGEATTPSLKNFDYNSTDQSFVDSTRQSQYPQIISIDVPDVSGGKQVVVTFTGGRDISNTLLSLGKTGEGEQWKFHITQDESLGPYTSSPVFSQQGTGVTPSKLGNSINTITFETILGEFQKGGTYSLQFSGATATDVPANIWTIRDQFDLSLNSVTFSGTNSVQNLEFYNAEVNTTDPSGIIAVFKKPGGTYEGQPFDVSIIVWLEGGHTIMQARDIRYGLNLLTEYSRDSNASLM